MTPAGGASIQDQSSRMSSSQQPRLELRTLFILQSLSPCWFSSSGAVDCPSFTCPCSLVLQSCSVYVLTIAISQGKSREWLQLVRLLSGTPTRRRAWDHSSGCGGCRGIPCGVAQRVLWALILRQLALWWKLPIWEVWGRREIKPGRPTDIQNSLWVWRRRVHGEAGGIQGPRQQSQCLRSGAVLASCHRGAGGETCTSRMDMAPVQDDQTGQQQRLVVVMWTPSYASGQQDAPLPLVMEHQGQQRHHQDEDNGAADDGIGDAGVIAETVIQCHKVLPWSFCCS